MDVLYEDNHLLAVNKPAMLPTMGVAEDRPSLLILAKDYVRRKYEKPGNVYLGIVSRLDAPVTGVVLMARTSKAAARLTEQFREREVEKVYWAIVEGEVEPPSGRLVDFLRKDERHRRMHVTGSSAPNAQRAELDYRVLTGQAGEVGLWHGLPNVPPSAGSRDPRTARGLTLLEVRPLTGRKHQIRVQLAQAGFPILSDRKYGGRRPFPKGIALHARRLVVKHPVLKTDILLEAPVPASWRTLIR